MLDRLQLIALALFRFRYGFYFLALLSAIIFSLALLEQMQLSADRHLIPATVIFCWSVTLLSFAKLFASVPGKPDKTSPWRQRLSIRLQRLFLGTLALLVVALSLALVVLSWQLLRTWLSA